MDEYVCITVTSRAGESSADFSALKSILDAPVAQPARRFQESLRRDDFV